MQNFQTFCEETSLSKADKKVVMMFLDQKAGSNKKLFTDGVTLEGLWIGGRDIAFWKNGKIHMGQVESRSKQQIQRFVKKTAPKFDLA